METLIIILLVLILLNQRRLVRNTPPRDDNSFEWQVRYATRCVIAIVLASVATALWLTN